MNLVFSSVINNFYNHFIAFYNIYLKIEISIIESSLFSWIKNNLVDSNLEFIQNHYVKINTQSNFCVNVLFFFSVLTAFLNGIQLNSENQIRKNHNFYYK